MLNARAISFAPELFSNIAFFLAGKAEIEENEDGVTVRGLERLNQACLIWLRLQSAVYSFNSVQQVG